MLFVAVTLMVGSVTSLHDGRVWDPYTGEQVESEHTASSCVKQAHQMLESEDISPKDWTRGVNEWREKCETEAPRLVYLLENAKQAGAK